MTDLENRVRDALRTDEIGWDDLRRPTLRVAARPARRWPAVLATAAAVVVVAAVATVLVIHRNGTSNAPAGNHPAYAGYTWKLTGLADRQGPILGASGIPADIAFSDTSVSGALADRFIFGHYARTPKGYALIDLDLAGTEGTIGGGSELRVGRAFINLFARDTTERARPDLARPATVGAHVTGDSLVLHANGVTARLTRVGPSGLSPVIDAVGYVWQVTALTDIHGRLTIPARLPATVEFHRTGFVVADDTVARARARFGLNGTGYVVADHVTANGSGSAGRDRTLGRLRTAIRGIVSSNAVVTAALDGDTLTLRGNASALTLRRGEPVAQSRLTMTPTNHSATP